MNKQLLFILLILSFILSFPVSAQAGSVETASANLTGTETSPTPELEPAPVATTLAEGQNEPGVSPIQPPAQTIPPLWGLALGLVLVIGAALAARFLKNRR
jgi:hypothetical protein